VVEQPDEPDYFAKLNQTMDRLTSLLAAAGKTAQASPPEVNRTIGGIVFSQCGVLRLPLTQCSISYGNQGAGA